VLFYNTICIDYYDTFSEKAGKKPDEEKNKQQKNYYPRTTKTVVVNTMSRYVYALYLITTIFLQDNLP
jgi:hypothetical protein